MAKSDKKKVPFQEGPAKPVSLRLSREVLAALDDFRHGFDFRPSQSAVIERALRQFLGGHGYDLSAEAE